MTKLNNVSSLERDSFAFLQESFKDPAFLHHPNPRRRLYIDIDTSKEWGYGIMIYYIKENEIADGPLDHTVANNHYKIQPILFLSKLLTGAESRYWPTELEVVCLVWTVRKIRYLILGFTSLTIVYTDHSAIISIIK